MMQYTPIEAFRQTCDNEACTGTSYGVSVRLALSNLGMRWATVVQFHIFAATGTFLLRPSLQVEPVVPYSSPGFEVLTKLDLGRISFNRAKRELLRIYHNDSSFVRHVNPAGVSYLEACVIYPCCDHKTNQIGSIFSTSSRDGTSEGWTANTLSSSSSFHQI